MPPRTRRTVAQRQEEQVEREEAEDAPKNSSLRSFFPLELVKLILAELNGDLPSLASLCLVSFGCLEEASGELYRDAVVESDREMISFFCGGTKPKPRSRLLPHLSLRQVQTLTTYLPYAASHGIIPFLKQKSNGISYPARLSSSPVSLRRLQVAPPQSISLDGFRYALETLLLFVLPYLSPINVDIDISRWPTQGHRPLDWIRTLRAWSGSFRRFTLRGGDWAQVATFLGFGTKTQLILRDSPYVQSGGAFKLTLDARESQNEGDEAFVHVLRGMGLFGMVGLETKIMIANAEEKEWKEELAKLSEEERGRVEVVVVKEPAD